MTGGLARATSHRVLSPKGTTPRYSVPFFQNIGLEIRLADRMVKCKRPFTTISTSLLIIIIILFLILSFTHTKVPPEIAKLLEERGHVSATDCEFKSCIEVQALIIIIIIIINLNFFNKMNIAVNFSEFDREPSGKVNLIGRIKYVHRLFFLFVFLMCLSLVSLRQESS